MNTGNEDSQHFKMIHLSGVHHKINNYFLNYQAALFGGEMDKARQFWNQFMSNMSVHFEAEEKFLFPVIREKVPDLTSEVDSLLAEHKEINDLMTGISTWLNTIGEKKEYFVENLDLLELGTDLKLKIIRHAEREDGCVYPSLDRALSEEERERMKKHVIL